MPVALQGFSLDWKIEEASSEAESSGTMPRAVLSQLVPIVFGTVALPVKLLWACETGMFDLA